MKKRFISVRNAEFQIIQSLKHNRAKRHQLEEIFVEGIESIKQAISAGIEITRIVVYDEAGLSDWGKALVRTSKAQLIVMTFDLYKELCDRSEPSELLITAKVAPVRLEELTLPDQPVVLIFDRPSDHGNFGSLDGDAPAAYRYTEARLAPLATELLDEIKQGTVDFRPTFDGTAQEPIVLPARIPHLLANGCAGIAVGMATKIGRAHVLTPVTVPSRMPSSA